MLWQQTHSIYVHTPKHNSSATHGLCTLAVQELVESKIQAVTDFEWISRMRVYWRDDVFVEMVQVREYMCEWLCVTVSE